MKLLESMATKEEATFDQAELLSSALNPSTGAIGLLAERSWEDEPFILAVVAALLIVFGLKRRNHLLPIVGVPLLGIGIALVLGAEIPPGIMMIFGIPILVILYLIKAGLLDGGDGTDGGGPEGGGGGPDLG